MAEEYALLENVNKTAMPTENKTVTLKNIGRLYPHIAVVSISNNILLFFMMGIKVQLVPLLLYQDKS